MMLVAIDKMSEKLASAIAIQSREGDFDCGWVVWGESFLFFFTGGWFILNILGPNSVIGQCAFYSGFASATLYTVLGENQAPLLVQCV